MSRLLRLCLPGLLALLFAPPGVALKLSERADGAVETLPTAIRLHEIEAAQSPRLAAPPRLTTEGEEFYQPVDTRLPPPESGTAAVTVPPLPPLVTEGDPESRGVAALGIGRALELVWSENPQVLEAQKNIDAAGYDVKGAYGGYLPSVTVSNSTGRDSLSSVQASLPLWQGGLTPAQIDASKAREVVARATLDRVRLTLGGETLTAFYNVAQAQEQLRQWTRYLAALQRLNASISNRVREGVAADSEVQTAVSRIRQAEVGQEAARLLMLSSRIELGRLVKLTPETVQWRDDWEAEVNEINAIDLETLVDRQPDVMIATAQIAEQSALVREARSRFYPELALQYRHYYEGEAFDRTADAPQLVLQYQLGNSYSAYQRVNAEKSRVESARARLDTARREAQATLVATRQQLASSNRQFELQKQATANTQALVEGFLRQYKVGRRSWVEVLNAQREAHDNELNLIAARRAQTLTAQQLILRTLAWDALLRDPAAGS